MATIKRYRYIIDNDIDINDINDNINNKTYQQLKIYKGNSSNQAELIKSVEIEETISTDIDFTKTTFTEAEVETAIRYNAVSNFKVGDILTINNYYCSQWVVIGKNHDGTSGTIDIMSTTQVGTAKYSDGGAIANIYNIKSPYAGFCAFSRSYHEFINTTISSACKNISFKVASSKTEGVIHNAMAKIISCTELNFSSFDQYMPGYDTYKEGTGYTYFTRAAFNSTTVNKRWVAAGRYGSTSAYWTRSKWTGNNTTKWAMTSRTTCSYYSQTSEYGIVPILRLGSLL